MSPEEREAFAAAMHDCFQGWKGDPRGTVCGDCLDDADALADVVDQIAEARVRAALADIHSAFDLQCPPVRSHFADDDFGRGAWCAHSWWSTVLGAALKRATPPRPST